MASPYMKNMPQVAGQVTARIAHSGLACVQADAGLCKQVMLQAGVDRPGWHVTYVSSKKARTLSPGSISSCRAVKAGATPNAYSAAERGGIAR